MDNPKIYPAIYKSVTGDERLYLNPIDYYYRDKWNKSNSSATSCHRLDKNITAEYLRNSKIKILSKEHSLLIQELARHAGYIWSPPSINVDGREYFYFHENKYISFNNNLDYPITEEIELPEPPSEATPEPVKVNTEWTDKHYNFNYKLSEKNIKDGHVRVDSYFVNRMWKLNSWDDTGAAFHSLKTLARIINSKNPLERELVALYQQVNSLCKLHGVDTSTL
jgi:hypothetical protein